MAEADATAGDAGAQGARRLEAFLAQAGLDARVIVSDTPTPTPTAADAERALGPAGGRVIKTLLFGRPPACVAAIACGGQRIDTAALARLAGVERLRLASAADVLAVTGYPAGGVAPVGFAQAVPVFVDPQVLEPPQVVGGGGSDDRLLVVRPHDVVRLNAATVAKITLD